MTRALSDRSSERTLHAEGPRLLGLHPFRTVTACLPTGLGPARAARVHPVPFPGRYHKRSNGEAVNSSFKRKLGCLPEKQEVVEPVAGDSAEGDRLQHPSPHQVPHKVGAENRIVVFAGRRRFPIPSVSDQWEPPRGVRWPHLSLQNCPFQSGGTPTLRIRREDHRCIEQFLDEALGRGYFK